MASQDSFLARQTFGLSNWLWIAVAVVFVLPFGTRGARLAMQGAENQAKDWLPANYPESVDLAWFAKHFSSAQFVLVSWDGCTLEDKNGRLRLLVDKLHRELDDRGQRVFKEILTGPSQIESLTGAPANLTAPAAISRLEGALVGPELLAADGTPLGSEQRVTCLVAYMSPHITSSNRRMRAAIERIEQVATEECGVPVASLRMAGPPVDNVTIDKQGEQSLRRLALLAGLIGIGIAYVSFRSVKLTLAVFSVAALSAIASLGIVYWFGRIEVFWFDVESPRFGKMDAVLNSMPAVVYVLGLSGAIHVVNYYRDERAERGAAGAIERSVRISWGPCLLAAVTTAVGLMSLGASHIVPVEKFGVMTGISVLATTAILFTVLPVVLHVFVERGAAEKPAAGIKPRGSQSVGTKPAFPRWAQRLAELVARRNLLVGGGCCLVMVAMAAGLPRIESSVELLKLLDKDVDLIHDYAWIEENLGNLVPVEVVIALDADQQRGPDGLAEPAGADRYRMTMVERLRMSRRIQERIEEIGTVSRALSAATFGPEPSTLPSRGRRRAADYATSTALEEPATLDALVGYIQPEIAEQAADQDEAGQDDNTSPRQLWRVSARVAALAGVDYGQFLGELRSRVAPVMAAYRARDELVAHLHAQGKTLADARVAVVYRDARNAAGGNNPAGSTAGDPAAVELYRLLQTSDTQHAARAINADRLDAATQEHIARYNQLDAIVTLDDPSLANSRGAKQLTNLVTLGGLADSGVGFEAVYTGIVPLVYKTQGELISSLQHSMFGAAVLIAGVMVVLLRSPVGGLLAMLPNLFPVVLVFGALGWIGYKVDIGVMMTASVALGVAVDDTIHFLTWFRRGAASGLNRRGATLLAYERCAAAMTQTTLVAGLGLMVFATSTFTPSQQFGVMMVTMLAAALLGDLLLLPALLCSPLGVFLTPKIRQPQEPPGESHAVTPATQPPAPRVIKPPAAIEPTADTQLLGRIDEPNTPQAGNDKPQPMATEPQPEAVVLPFPQPIDPASSSALPSNTPHTDAPRTDGPLSPDNATLRDKLRRFRRG